MKILVTGGTGMLGREVVKALLERGSAVKVLTRKKDTELPTGAEAVIGDLTDPASIRSALEDVDKMFLLVGNVADELTQALLALAVAKEAKIKHLTYLSVYNAEKYPECPHFIGKHTVETALKTSGIPYTILRPGYFFQNDAGLKDLLKGPGVFPTPIGTAGVAAVDIRDIADAAAISLTTDDHAGATYDLVSPVAHRGPQAAAIWSEALGRAVVYPDLTPEAFETELRKMIPGWMALDLRLMFQAYQEGRSVPDSTDGDSVARATGHPARQYKAFATEAAASWAGKL